MNSTIRLFAARLAAFELPIVTLLVVGSDRRRAAAASRPDCGGRLLARALAGLRPSHRAHPRRLAGRAAGHHDPGHAVGHGAAGDHARRGAPAADGARALLRRRQLDRLDRATAPGGRRACRGRPGARSPGAVPGRVAGRQRTDPRGVGPRLPASFERSQPKRDRGCAGPAGAARRRAVPLPASTPVAGGAYAGTGSRARHGRSHRSDGIPWRVDGSGSGSPGA